MTIRLQNLTSLNCSTRTLVGFFATESESLSQQLLRWLSQSLLQAATLAAVDRQRRASDEPRLLRAQKRDNAAEVRGLSEHSCRYL